MRRFLSCASLSLAALACVPAVALAGAIVLAEYGDAPDGGLAYPGTSVVGKFPTCEASPNGRVKHLTALPLLHWGSSVDFEPDGNGGTCAWPPYDQDECGGALDTDAGLLFPSAFTVQGGAVVACGQAPFTSLGPVCGLAYFGVGQAIDLTLVNNTTNDAWVQVLVDWNQDGAWGGQSVCALTGAAPEWAVQNVRVPAGFQGSLSALLVTPLRIGPNPGYVWARFTVHDGPLIGTPDWNGAGTFDTGESEDYLLRIDPDGTFGELGDAPQGVLAYPAAGTVGNFPTCVASGSYIWHGFASGGALALGPALDGEFNGNHDDCGFVAYDNDECGPGDGDAGLITPGAYTISPVGAYVLCPPSASATIGQACEAPLWGGEFDVHASNFTNSEAYLQILADWDHDGAWTTNVATCPPATTATEQVVLNLPIPAGFSGAVSTLSPPPFALPSEGHVWFRISLTPAPVPMDWDGSGLFADGETEDYLLFVSPLATGVPPPSASVAFAIERAQPNPASDAVAISFRLAAASRARLWVADLAGRRVATLVDREFEPGPHLLRWSGDREDGRPAGPGLYFIRGEAAGVRASVRVTRLR